jgi:hypothetical protein
MMDTMDDDHPFTFPQKRSLSKSERMTSSARHFGLKHLLRRWKAKETQSISWTTDDASRTTRGSQREGSVDGASLSASESSKSEVSNHGCLKVRTQEKSLAQTLNQSSASTPKEVDWGELEIRTYEVILGDNPSASKGPPVAIGWTVLDEHRLDIDSYESLRSSRRSKLDLILPSCYRDEWLREEGYSRAELRNAIVEARCIKHERLSTYRGSKWQRLGRAMASVLSHQTK